MNTQKVIPLFDTKLYDDIMIFLNEMGIESEHTRRAYETDIRQFFKLIKGKDLEHLTLEDLQLRKNDIEMFKQILLDNGTARSTINRKVAALRSLLKSLKANEWDIKIDFFHTVKSLKTQDDQYDALEIHEVEKMAELALEEVNDAQIKHYLILFALDTCMRKSALLNLKWSDFEVHENEVFVNYIDKGKKEFRKKISKSFYNKLLSIKKEGEERVFPISVYSVDEMMKRLRKKMNIDPNRRIVFHSIRKAAITFHYRKSKGDIIQAKKAAGHSNIQTTMRYIKEPEYEEMGAVSCSSNLDEELYKKVTHEELIKAIENCPKDLQLILNIQLNEIINNKNRQ